MKIESRPYQTRDMNLIRNEYATGHRSVLYQLATGGGKTIVSSFIVDGARKKQKSALFLCNRRELIKQTSATFSNMGISHGIFSAGYPYNECPIQIGSVDTIRSRLSTINLNPDLVIWDECRGIGAVGWTKVYNHFKNSKHLGLDATPKRGDGKALREYFSAMVCGPSIKELIEMGSLVPPEMYAPDEIDISSVAITRGDYNEGDLQKVMDKPHITGSAIDHYIKYGEGRQGLIFCVGIKHSMSVAEQFRERGINAVHVDADTKNRDEIVEQYRAGEIDLLCSVNLFIAGFDVPNVSYIGCLRHTQSITVFLQMCGRGARPCSGKKNYILMDHVSNYKRFGWPHSDREWTLDAPEKKKASEKSTSEEAVDIQRCMKCHLLQEGSFKICPECGHVHEVKERKIIEKEGELKKLTEKPEKIVFSKSEDKDEVKSARTYGEFQAIGRKRGYKPGWAYKQWELKKWRINTKNS